MHVTLEPFIERQNKFFNAMLIDLNPKIYAISSDRFVYYPKKTAITGVIPMPNAEVTIFINGKLADTVLSDGSGQFSASINLVNNENNIIVEYVPGRSRAAIITP